eukprot:TRINITY_DN122518_c0_g1_i1.p1 TRINITY_DN122518_c0_g1~~TRINITY_DN122518_c0_g1_i1.p1  ORF type:complete len:558 (-),score=100.32 TRINITY_DN122518_c0_g1_i1:105-1778(-)
MSLCRSRVAGILLSLLALAETRTLESARSSARKRSGLRVKRVSASPTATAAASDINVNDATAAVADQVPSASDVTAAASAEVSVVVTGPLLADGTPEANAMDYTVAMPTDRPHEYSGTYCRGLGCAFRRSHIDMMAEMLAKQAMTTPSPFGMGSASGAGSPYFCRGLGCPPKIAHPKDLAVGGFTKACAQLAGYQAVPAAPATDSDSINRLIDGQATPANTAPDAGTGFEAACGKAFPAEAPYCGAYADILRAATAVAGLPPFANAQQACGATYAFVGSAKEAEVHLELTLASLEGKVNITADQPGSVPQSQTMYEVAPGSDVLPPVEVPGELFAHCKKTMSVIVKDAEPKNGPAYVRETKAYCDSKANAAPDVSAGPDAWRPDWKGSCEGMEQLVGYALRESLELDSGPLSEQEVCVRLFQAVGSVHRLDKIVNDRVALLPEMQLMAPPGPPTVPPPPPLPVGPTLPPADDAGILSIMATSQQRQAEAKEKLSKIAAAQQAAAAARQAVQDFVNGGGADAGTDAAAPVALPSVSDLDMDSRAETAERLRRLRGLSL